MVEGSTVWQMRVVVSIVLCNFALLAAQQITDPDEVNILQVVRRKLNDPLKRLRNWKKKTDPCNSNWIGLICNTSTDGYLHVQELRMLRMNLTGTLAPELGQLSHLKILDFMWNNLSGSIPKEIGSITTLQFLLLSGNQISGPLPPELGLLHNLTKFQLDMNHISGPIPTSFAQLPKVKHFHMNNNSISGQIPPELYKMPSLEHVLLDNNNLTGYLPPELAQMPNLKILQLDNNNFGGTMIPGSFGNMSKLLKLSLRNCNLQGSIPDLSGIPGLLYVDLSKNNLTGNIPSNKLSGSVTTIILSNNQLNGSIPYVSGFPFLQNLSICRSLSNNLLSGFVPSTIWGNMTFSSNGKLLVDFQHNLLSDISGTLNPPSNVSVLLQGNPVCANANSRNIVQFCGPTDRENIVPDVDNDNSSDTSCPPYSCPPDGYEYVPSSPHCFCAAPFGVGIRLRSPSISDFSPYKGSFEKYLTTHFNMQNRQIYVNSFLWEKGPRLKMLVKFFPMLSNVTQKFSSDEIQWIIGNFSTFAIPGHDMFGPYDLLNFTGGIYTSDSIPPPGGHSNKGGVAGIVLGAISCTIAVIMAIAFMVLKVLPRFQQHVVLNDKTVSFSTIKVGIKKFSFEELNMTTRNFSSSAQIGQGGYGKVYKGVLGDGTVVAIKRAQQGSVQGEKEFHTEIEFLSRVHHRNLVSLIGYCDEEQEQILVYEFMPNGSLGDLLSAKNRGSLSFRTRLDIGLGAAKGILYLHTEADPPIFHLDIKANNILLDSKFNAKVSDFGISKLAPVPNGRGFVVERISTVIKGTPGYIDPEYFMTRQLSEKIDVYSLGIILLELLTGMEPISNGRNIVEEVTMSCESGMMYSIIDPRMGLYPLNCVKRLMGVAVKCAHKRMKVRPTMLEVVRELENIGKMIPESDKIKVSTPGMSEVEISPLISVNSRRQRMSSDMSVDDSPGTGSNLVSGVFPTITHH